MTESALLLSAEEIAEMTGYQKPSLQVRELLARGFVRARRNAMNRVVLERAHYDAVCRGVDAANESSLERPRVLPPRSARKA